MVTPVSWMVVCWRFIPTVHCLWTQWCDLAIFWMLWNTLRLVLQAITKIYITVDGSLKVSPSICIGGAARPNTCPENVEFHWPISYNPRRCYVPSFVIFGTLWKYLSHHLLDDGGVAGRSWRTFPKLEVCIGQSYIINLRHSEKAKCYA